MVGFKVKYGKVKENQFNIVKSKGSKQRTEKQKVIVQRSQTKSIESPNSSLVAKQSTVNHDFTTIT